MQTTSDFISANKKDVFGFDLLKFIMALLIVSIHTEAFETIPFYRYIRVIQTWCVPTFFFLSSYFVMRKFVNSSNRIEVYLNFIKRLGILYVAWFIINTPIFIKQHNYSGVSLYEGVTEFLKSLLFASTFEGSWFLSALGMSVSILIILTYLRINKWVIFGIFTMIYLYVYAMECNLFNNQYVYVLYNWYKTNIYDIPTLSFPRGLPFIAMGYLMATFYVSNNIHCFSKYHVKHCIPFILIVFIYVSASIDNQLIIQIITLSAVPFIIIYFKWMDLPPSTIWKSLRDCSILLYLLHFMIIVYFRHIPILCQFTGLTKYLSVLCIAGVVSYTIIRFSQISKTKIFKYLY